MLNNWIYKTLLVLLLVCGGLAQAWAEHIAGATISYRRTNVARQYDITLTIYRDCASTITPLAFEKVAIREGANGPVIDSVRVTRVAGAAVDVGNICPPLANRTRCNAGGTINSIERVTYRGTYTFPRASDAWYMSWVNCLRSGALLGTVTPPTPSQNCIYVEAFLDNSQGDNSSPTFDADPTIYLCVGSTYSLNQSATDPDGDRVTYQLVPIQYASGQDFAYNPPFSRENPTNSTNPWFVNRNGQITLSASQSVISAYAVEIRAFRDGRLVNTVRRDMMVFVEDCNNQPPAIADAIGANVFNGDTIVWCSPYQEQTVIFNSIDSDASQATRFENIALLSQLFPGAVFNNIPGTQPGERGRMIMTWAPPLDQCRCSFIRFQLKVSDDACPRQGVATRTFAIKVSCPVTTLPARTFITKCNRPVRISNKFTGCDSTQRWEWIAVTNRTGTVYSTEASPLATEGEYVVRGYDRFGCFGISDTIVVAKPYFGVPVQNGTCLGPLVPPPLTCPYETCVGNFDTWTHQILNPSALAQRQANGDMTNYRWYFDTTSTGTGPAIMQPGVGPNGRTTFAWPNRGNYRFWVCFYNPVDTCDYCDTAQINVCKKPDLKLKVIDSCNSSEYRVLNEGTPQIQGCGMHFNSWIYRLRRDPNTGAFVRDSVLDLHNPPTDPNPVSQDTIKLNAGTLTGVANGLPQLELRLQLANNCGDTTVFIPINLYSRPILWEGFDTSPDGMNLRTFIAGCPTYVIPSMSPDRGTRPFRFFYERADYILYDSIGVYLRNFGVFGATVTDAKGCSYKTVFRIAKAAQAKLLYRSECVNNSFGITTSVDISDPCRPRGGSCPESFVIPAPARHVIWVWGDGTRDTLRRGTTLAASRGQHIYQQTGLYNVSLIIVSDSGCSDTSTLSVYIETERPKPTFTDTVLCFVSVDASGVKSYEPLKVIGGLSPGVFKYTLMPNVLIPRDTVSLTYFDGTDGLLTYNFFRPGIYRGQLITRYSNGCSFRDTFRVRVVDSLNYNFDLSKVCSGTDSFDLKVIIPNQASRNRVATYRFDMGDGNVITQNRDLRYAYAVDNQYVIQASIVDTNGCVYPTDGPRRINFIPPAAVRPCLDSLRDVICTGKTFTFSIARGCLPQENYGFMRWTVVYPSGLRDTVRTNDPVFSRTFNEIGRHEIFYTVVAADAECSVTGSSYFVVSEPATVRASINRPCRGEPFILNLSPSIPSTSEDSIRGYFAQLPDGTTLRSQSPVFTFLIPVEGLHRIVAGVETKGNCTGTDTVVGYVKPKPRASFRSVPDPIIVRTQDTITFISESTTGLDSRNVSFRWDFGDSTAARGSIAVKKYEVARRYRIQLIVTNDEGCSDTTVQFYDLRPHFVLPTAFSPNGDGVNDEFRLIYRGIDNLVEFKIYNRLGQVVYEGNNLQSGWDGKFNDVPQPSGVYVFRATGRTVYGEEVNLDGRVVLIR